jgi:5'-nucleotidase
MTDAPTLSAGVPPTRRIYANRTLNLRAIAAVGYDMDYTLVHYRVSEWERYAYDHVRGHLADEGWPVSELTFQRELAAQGLVVDTELGNIVKANRFGYVMRAAHGSRLLSFDEQRTTYRHTPVDLSEPRFVFLNTLFALSGTCLYAQLVDLFDEGLLQQVAGYRDLFQRINDRLDEAHLEGRMKAAIAADPERFIELDPDAPMALLDQQRAGKRLMLVSNSEWSWVREIMTFAYDPFLPPRTTWRDLFDLVVAGARKPDFFSQNLPLFRIVDTDRGLLEPVPGHIPGPGLYLGGDAAKVEEYLGLSGSQILYVGDHIFADVRVSKSVLRWRTALVLRELEEEISALEAFRDRELELSALMATKECLESEQSGLRLARQRLELGYGSSPGADAATVEARLEELRRRLEELDGRIAPLARAASEVVQQRWGPLLRAGNDTSHLARQIERSADIYTSRVSNFLHVTPFAYLRSKRASMPHDPVIVSRPLEDSGDEQE